MSGVGRLKISNRENEGVVNKAREWLRAREAKKKRELRQKGVN